MWQSWCTPASTSKTTSKELSAGPDNGAGEYRARGLRTYGCILDADAQREGINASTRYPKNWVQSGDPARESTMIQSQINRNIRLDLADAILLSKAKKISHLPRLPTAPVWQKPL